MKKGFTLVELIGVIVIVGLIILVGVPAMTKTLKKTNEDEQQRALTDLYLAAENYIQINRENFPTLNEAGGETYISLNELKNAGYLRANIINPGTEKVFDYTRAIRVFRNADDTLDYEYSENYYGVDSYISDDSLLVHYDALNNQGVGVYDESASTWKDLSGNNNDGATNGAIWNNGKLYFDGKNVYIDMGDMLIDLFKNDMTFEIVVNFDSSSYRAIILGNHPESNNVSIEKGRGHAAGDYLYPKTSRIYYDGGSVDYYTEDDFFDLETLNTYSYELKKNDTSFIFYRNSESQYQTTNSIFANNFDFGNAKIGADNREADLATSQGVYMEGEVYAIRIYNRALTEEELKYNYEIDKLRFNMQ